MTSLLSIYLMSFFIITVNTLNPNQGKDLTITYMVHVYLHTGQPVSLLTAVKHVTSSDASVIGL